MFLIIIIISLLIFIQRMLKLHIAAVDAATFLARLNVPF